MSEEEPQEWPPKREDTIILVEVNGTPVRVVRESWKEPRTETLPGERRPGYVTRCRYWVEVGVGVLTPEQAQAFARAVQSCADRATHLQAGDDEDNDD